MTTVGMLQKKQSTYKKPHRPCIFCNLPQARLKRHILTKHSKHPSVIPLHSMTVFEQDEAIKEFRREGIRMHNIKELKSGSNEFLRQRKAGDNDDLPFMCSGCKGFFSKSYKTRHQQVCSSSSSNFLMPVVPVETFLTVENFPDEYKSLLNSLQIDEVGTYIKTDPIILNDWESII